MSDGPDLSRVKPLSPAELRARREARERATSTRAPTIKRPRKTVVRSVSVPKILGMRAEIEIGEGSFSRGVVKALQYYLDKVIDKEKARERKYRE